MHPRSPYKDNPPSFSDLAFKVPSFAPYVTNHGRSIDFQNPDAVRELARALLLVDFNLSVKLPKDRLCPMVPNRLNYVLFLQDLIDTSTRNSWSQSTDATVRGLDIGTGASCIYPLLAVRQRPNWSMVASELDDNSRLYAIRNVTENMLESRITVIPPTEDPRSEVDTPTVLPLLEAVKAKFPRTNDYLFDYTMVNPPFYTSSDELLESAEKKNLPPNSACTGAPVEMIFEGGGEKSFIEKMITESVQPEYRTSYARWYTTLCGKKSTVDEIIPFLKNSGIGNFLVRRLETGDSGTIRWVVCWSFSDHRPPPQLVHGFGIKKEWLSEMGILRLKVSSDAIGTLARLKEILAGLPLFTHNSPADDESEVWGQTPGDCWSRKYRRAVERGGNTALPRWQQSKDRLGVRIYVGKDRITDSWGESAEGAEDGMSEDTGTTVSVYWTEGTNRVIFESFSGMIKRGLASTV